MSASEVSWSSDELQVNLVRILFPSGEKNNTQGTGVSFNEVFHFSYSADFFLYQKNLVVVSS